MPLSPVCNRWPCLERGGGDLCLKAEEELWVLSLFSLCTVSSHPFGPPSIGMNRARPAPRWHSLEVLQHAVKCCTPQRLG